MSDVTVGQPAPAVSLPRDGGDVVSLADFSGKQVVLYFYPKDDTPGCTKEAVGFTDKVDEFAAAGAVILGVSKDSVVKHEKFRKKHDLNIALLSDEDGDVCERYGVWVKKNMYGKTYMGIERATFLIGADGNIKEIWRKVKVPGHVDAVLAAVKG
ncbi:peroxiredoxin Q/BCP [Cognatiyoonia koreensis]|uniref:thioredoxin-dependent peroxiredoxin n=1 Tax=Cognatiyoonia koreensis TaxID=364200 RepID=A0A1I0PNJ2_9RHOB|nr:thioredoxin-dependent thiol peroxidase [Cognatiyoonia koreensis]SEW15916.1 peroxiredoxin Q/BCP [Cognatiyoonia koreensis]